MQVRTTFEYLIKYWSCLTLNFNYLRSKITFLFPWNSKINSCLLFDIFLSILSFNIGKFNEKKWGTRRFYCFGIDFSIWCIIFLRKFLYYFSIAIYCCYNFRRMFILDLCFRKVWSSIWFRVVFEFKEDFLWRHVLTFQTLVGVLFAATWYLPFLLPIFRFDLTFSFILLLSITLPLISYLTTTCSNFYLTLNEYFVVGYCRNHW